MDIIKQNKFIGWIIAVLVVINVITISIIWLQSGRKNSAPVKEGVTSPSGSARLLQDEIGLNEDQTMMYQKMQEAYREKNKNIKDDLDDLKIKLVDELFSEKSDEKLADSISSKIGNLQYKVELMRFEHFRDLVRICNPDQKEKLRPILKEVFGRKGANPRPDDKRPQDLKKENERKEEPPEKKDKKKLADELDEGKVNENPQKDDRPAPPSKEEKLMRYANKLNLSEEQIKKVEKILDISNKKGEALKTKSKPGQPEFEPEKKKIRDEEDESILKILTPNQKEEFEFMIRNRPKR